MRIVIDECVPIAVPRLLRERGHEVLAITELASGAIDESVLGLAFEHDCLLITADTDFGELVYRAGAQHRGVLLLRFGDLANADQAIVVADVIGAEGPQTCWAILGAEPPLATSPPPPGYLIPYRSPTDCRNAGAPVTRSSGWCWLSGVRTGTWGPRRSLPLRRRRARALDIGLDLSF
ncbi:MAG: DUF5615 family PIN-like protein [Chloroflexi bacterium]|nr:DUF5615 family PIN-like protein [Chloroflexota bacterium]